MDRTIHPAPNFSLSIENGQVLFSPNTWQMTTFLNSLDALIPKILFSCFAEFWGGQFW